MEETKTRKFLIATHGRFAGGIKSSLDVIIGQMENVFLIEAYIDENRDIENEINKVLDSLEANEELIVFTDLLGGSITNLAVRGSQGKDVHVVSGFNLALLIEVLMADAETPAEEVIEGAIESGKQQMVYVTKLMAANNAEDNND